MRKAAVTLAAFMVSLAAPAMAHSDSFDTYIAQLQPLAQQWWAAQGLTNTHCGEVTFERVHLEDAWGANNYAVSDPGVWFPTCRIQIADAIALDAPTTWYWGHWVLSKALLCEVVLHEWGHLLLGPQHSVDPASIMYERPLIPPVCVAWAQPPKKGLGMPLSWTHRHSSDQHLRWAAFRVQRRLR
jgi:hypothetical protein